MTMGKKYTAKEVYDLGLLRLKPRTLMEYARTDRITSYKEGRTVLFSEEDIAKFQESCRRAPKTKPTRAPKYAGRN